MKTLKKNKLFYILIYIIILIASYHIKICVDGYHDSRERMYDDFEAFGIELETLNDHLSQILVLHNYDFHEEKEFVNNDVIWDFRMSNYDAARIGKGKAFNDYDDIYLKTNNVIHNIVADEIITTDERKYLKSLYSFNKELLNEYNHIIGDVRTNWDYDKIRKLEKGIVKIYNGYSKKAEELLNTPTYKFLNGYKGEFKDVGFERAKAYSEEVFSKIVKDETLNYNNKEEVNNDEYVFRTYLKRDFEPKTIGSGKTDYEVSYNKQTNKVLLRAVSYSVKPTTTTYKENEIDKIANKIIYKFNKNPFNYDKEVKYEEGGKLDYIRYYYIENINGVYDEMKKIEIEIQNHGLVSQFKIMYPNNQEIIMPTISKEEILAKIDKDAEIVDFIVVRNIEGKTEYVAHLKYEGTLFEAILDGESGKVKYYGSDINKRYLINK